MRRLFCIVSILAVSALAGEPKESDWPLVGGSYELVGSRFDSGDAFHGTMLIEESTSGFTITRVIGGKRIVGTGRIEFATADKIPVLRIRFEEEGREMEGTYQFHADLDNFGRLTGYVYPKDLKAGKPGLEALFAEKKWANQRPDGTSAKAPLSKPSQGAAVPHP